jgi:hypothetical protein
MIPNENPNPNKLIDFRAIDSIKTPLGFFSLVMLIGLALLYLLAQNSSEDNLAFMTRAILGMMAFVVVLVAIAILFKQEAIWGKRYTALEESFARGLGEDLFSALGGYLGNLEDTARVESYEQLRSILTSAPYARTKKTKDFCDVLLITILRRAEIQGEVQKKIGLAVKNKT